MIEFSEGSLFDSGAAALVNPVNVVGVMGKGLALEFSKRFPKASADYRAACADGRMKLGQVFAAEEGGVTILHFPTKQHWRNPSKLEYIMEGLHSLVETLRSRGIASVAVPPLGCGCGGLDWARVRPLIVSALDRLPEVQVLIYGPAIERSSQGIRHIDSCLTR